MLLEVEHSEESVSVIRQKIRVFRETNRIIREAKECMIKLYPIRDTLLIESDNNYKLNGLISGYFCEVKVYDMKRKIFYVSKILHDEIKTQGLSNTSVSYFKDFGILHVFNEPVKIDYTQSMLVKKG